MRDVLAAVRSVLVTSGERRMPAGSASEYWPSFAATSVSKLMAALRRSLWTAPLPRCLPTIDEGWDRDRGKDGYHDDNKDELIRRAQST